MRIVPISGSSKDIVDTMRDLIARGVTEHLSKTTSGWRYGGEEFLESVHLLQETMQEELKSQAFNVVGCTVRHFSRGANIQNPNYPTKRLLIIPINGISTLSLGGGESVQLPPDTCCYIENTPTLSGEGIDVIFVAFEAEKNGP